MAGLGSLYIDLLARTGKFETDIGRAAKMADRRAKEIQRSFQGIGSKIGSAIAGIGVGISFRAIIDATVQAEKAMSALELAVRNNAGAAGLAAPELAGMASELQKLSTFDDEAIMQMQAVLLRFREIGGPEFKRAQTAVIDLATALGQDLGSAAALVGRALADPVGGMSRLARAGIVLTDEQKKLAKQLVETGRVSDAQNYLLGQLEAKFGGAARAARNTLGGALTGLKNAFGDLLEAKGGLPEATVEINKLTELLQDPATVAAADTLTTGLIRGFGAAAKFIADTAGAIRFLGEELAATIHGAAADDIVRLEDQIASLQRLLDEPTRRLYAIDFGSRFRFSGNDEIRAQISRLQELADQARKTQEARAAALNQAPGTAATSGKGSEIPMPPSEEFTKLSEKFQEQIALYGKVGKAAEISYQIQSGALDELSASEQQQLLALARRYDATVKSSDAQKKANEEQQKAVDEVNKMTQTLEEQIATFGMSDTAVLEYRLAHGDLALAFKNSGEEGEALKRKLIDLTSQFEMMTDAAKKAADAIDDFQKNNSESLDEGLKSFEEDFEKRFLKASEALTVFQEQAARNTQDIIADALISGFEGGAKGILKAFGDMIVKLTAQAVAADLAKRLFGDPSTSGDGWVGAAAGWLAGAFGGGRAIGGPVLAGTTYRINEREPEFFRPRVGGNIIPLSKMPSGGGLVLTQNFSVRTETGERVSRSTEQQIAAAASRGMAIASRRNN